MKLSSIRIKGMHNVSDKKYDLGNTNLIYFFGKNGAGKSTILQAIQLALLGYIPGTNKTTSAIFKHSNGPEMSVELTLTGDTTAKITRSWKKKGKDVVSSVDIEPKTFDVETVMGAVALPIFDFSEFTSMTANKLKDWFINFLPAADNAINWDSELRDILDEKEFGKILNPQFVDETINTVKGYESKGVEQIRKFNTHLKEMQSFYKGALSRIQSTIQSLILYDDYDEYEFTVEELKSEINDLRLKSNNATTKINIVRTNERTKSQISQYTMLAPEDNLDSDEHYKQLKNELDKYTATYESESKNMEDSSVKSAKLSATLRERQAILDGNGVCPYTSTTCESITQKLEQIKSEVATILVDIQNAKDEYDKSAAACSEANTKYKAITAELHNIETAYGQKSSLTATLNPDAGEDSVEQLTNEGNECSKKIDEITNIISKIEANNRYHQLTDSLTAEKYETEQIIEILKVWVKLTDVNGLQSKVMCTPFQKFAESITTVLNELVPNNNTLNSAKFHLTDKANSFSFGVQTVSGDYIEYNLLSSGEKCIYTLALLISLVRSSDSNLPIILIDDLLDHLDDVYIDSIFNGLSNVSDIQTILAGVKHCNVSNAVVNVER